MKRTPLRPGGWLRRLTPLRKWNRKRRARRQREDRVYGSYHRWVSGLPCIARSSGRCLPGVVGHHVKSVGAGGEDAGNLVPACPIHHIEIHTNGRARFEAHFSVDLQAEAARLYEAWSEHQREGGAA